MAIETTGAPGGEKPTTPTHVTTTPTRRPATPLDTFRVELVAEKGGYWPKIVNYFGGDEDRARKFASALTFSVQRNPKLLIVDRESLYTAGMACAEFELYPSNVAGEAFIIPYKGKAQFQLGYQGIITLFYRAGITIRAEIVRTKDFFEYEEGLVTRLVHRPDPFLSAEARGEPIGAYAVGTLADGRTYHKVMNAEDILGFRKFSQSFTSGSDFSPWKPGNDPELWMWKKTVIKQLAKTIPKTEKLQQAIERDDEESTIAERKNALDAGGIATPRANHAPDARDGNVATKQNAHGDENLPPVPPEELGACGKHPKSHTDGDGDCKTCVADALSAQNNDGGLPVINHD